MDDLVPIIHPEDDIFDRGNLELQPACRLNIMQQPR